MRIVLNLSVRLDGYSGGSGQLQKNSTLVGMWLARFAHAAKGFPAVLGELETGFSTQLFVLLLYSFF
jgi:hypothetical protein